MADDVLVINNPPRRRESKSGKVRYTIEVKSEPLIHNLDPTAMGKPVAEALATALRNKVLAIEEIAAPVTLRARAAAAKAFAGGAGWAVKRYGGGKMGPMAPNQSDRMFNDSGRFAQSIVAGARGGGWTINVAANRLDAMTSGGELGVRRIWNRLVALVPAFGNTALLFDEQAIKNSIQQSVDGAIVKAAERRDELTEQRAKAVAGIVKSTILSAVG